MNGTHEEFTEKIGKLFLDGNFDEAYSLISEGVGENYPPALFILGDMYFEGFGVDKNISTGIDTMICAVERGSAEAAYYLGIKYYYGFEDLAVDRSLAIEYLEKSAELGSVKAMGFLALILMANGDYKLFPEKVYKYANTAAHGNNVDGMIVLGDCYREGIVADRNPHEAAFWYRRALENGAEDDTRVMLCLSDCLSDTVGDFGFTPTREMLEEGFYWANKAYESGDIYAGVEIAAYYMNGDYVELDLEKAHYYVQDSYNKGNEAAGRLLKNFRRNIFGKWIYNE